MRLNEMIGLLSRNTQHVEVRYHDYKDYPIFGSIDAILSFLNPRILYDNYDVTGIETKANSDGLSWLVITIAPDNGRAKGGEQGE